MADMIGRVIYPGRNYDLEASLRVHRLLVLRSLEKQWRFTGEHMTSGPLEYLMGYPGCGSSSGDTKWCSLGLCFANDLKSMVEKVNRIIWGTLCVYPGLATLTETVPSRPYWPLNEIITRLADYERGLTRQSLNSIHKRARVIRNVRLQCDAKGISLATEVTLSGSEWGLFWLARQEPPRWNEHWRLDTWLVRAEKALAVLAHTGTERKEQPNG